MQSGGGNENSTREEKKNKKGDLRQTEHSTKKALKPQLRRQPNIAFTPSHVPAHPHRK